MFKKLFLYLVIVSIPIFSGCFIKGKVVDENGVGQGGVTVTLSGDASMTTITDSSGNYQFGTVNNMLSAGNYTITPSGNFTPPNRNVSITNLTLGDLGDVPGPVSDVDFTTSPIVGVWKVYLPSVPGVFDGVPGTQYSHLFSDGTCGLESSIYPDEDGNSVNSPLLVLGTYTYENEVLTIDLDSAKDQSGAAFDLSHIDSCWLFSAFDYSVQFTSLYVKDEAGMTTPEWRIQAGGSIDAIPSLPTGCKNIFPFTFPFEVTLAIKQTESPGTYILNSW